MVHGMAGDFRSPAGEQRDLVVEGMSTHTFVYEKCIVTVEHPELTAEERERRMGLIKKEATRLLLAAYRGKNERDQQ